MFKYKFTFDIIPTHLQGTSSWNLFPCKTRNYPFYIVNVMGADVLALQRIGASAAMIFTLLNRINSVPARQGLRCIREE